MKQLVIGAILFFCAMLGAANCHAQDFHVRGGVLSAVRSERLFRLEQTILGDLYLSAFAGVEAGGRTRPVAGLSLSRTFAVARNLDGYLGLSIDWRSGETMRLDEIKRSVGIVFGFIVRQ